MNNQKLTSLIQISWNVKVLQNYLSFYYILVELPAMTVFFFGLIS
jgi:hypothetical protein